MRILLVLSVFLLSGCSQFQMTGTQYAIEGVGYGIYYRAKQSNDVVLVKGLNGSPNRLYMRRGWNKLWGPSSMLSESGVAYWQYLEKNRRIQFYDNVAQAMYSKYSFVMTEKTAIEWGKIKLKMLKMYPTQTDFAMWEHLMRSQAALREGQSELKQETAAFELRNKNIPIEHEKPGPHDVNKEKLFEMGFTYEKE